MITKEIKALNVLMVTPRYFPWMGGIETHVYEVGRRLVRAGVNVTLLTTVPAITASLPREDEVEGMHIIRVKAWPPQKDYYIAPEIYALIKAGKWDLVHCQGCHTCVAPLTMLAAKEAKIPYILTFHSGGNSSRIRNKMRSVQWRLQHPLLSHASKLIGVSSVEANYFRDLLHLQARQFEVIPNGVALPDLTQVTVSPSKQTLIISVGRLERFKGHQHIISALPIIRAVRPDAKLLILGTGPYEGTLRELAQSSGVAEHVEIRAIPASKRQEMVETLARATLVTLLSEYEAHPVAVMEALSLKRPVLVADSSGLREFAERGLARKVALQSTPEEIARAALLQIEQPIVPSAELALPTWDECAQQLLSVYNTSARRLQCVS